MDESDSYRDIAHQKIDFLLNTKKPWAPPFLRTAKKLIFSSNFDRFLQDREWGRGENREKEIIILMVTKVDFFNKARYIESREIDRKSVCV